jgi:transcriptional regulator with XRE-family HTH domain
MNTLSERLHHSIAKREKSPAELARAVKKTESAVSQWLSGEQSRCAAKI